MSTSTLVMSSSNGTLIFGSTGRVPIVNVCPSGSPLFPTIKLFPDVPTIISGSPSRDPPLVSPILKGILISGKDTSVFLRKSFLIRIRTLAEIAGSAFKKSSKDIV